MNESEWLICVKPDSMLLHLQGQCDFHALRRKLRLFICACCRLGWDLITTPEARAAVAVAEYFADGRAPRAVKDDARTSIMSDVLLRRMIQHDPRIRRLIHADLQDRPPQTLAILATEAGKRLGDAAKQASAYLVRARTEKALGPNAHQRPGSEWKHCQTKQRAIICNVLREIFGNPFRNASVHSFWLAWNDCIVPRLSQAIYDERAFDRLPILADALEEAGCDNADILNHCRQPGEHVRGCWVVDLLLGKT